MSIKRKTTRKQTVSEKRLAKEVRPFYDYLNNADVYVTFTPFLKCSATYGFVEYEGDTWIVLKSYKTIVSAYLLGSQTLVHFGRYSATTYQHQRKFEHFVEEEYLHFRRDVCAYWLDYEDWYN